MPRLLVLRYSAAVATACLVALFYQLAQPEQLPTADRAALAAPLRLEAVYLEGVTNKAEIRSIRAVNPSLASIAGWISSVGAAVAVADMQGIGRSADICLVDPRADEVSVRPAPGTGERYLPFVLPNPAEGFDPVTVAPMGCMLADFNEDGLMDVLIYYWGRTPVIFLRLTPAMETAAFRPIEIVSEREIWNTNAAILADVDGDGAPDLLFGNYYQDGARVLDPGADEAVAMQRSMSRAANGGRNRLLLWEASTADGVIYRDATGALPPEFTDGWTLALASRDLDDAHLRALGPEAVDWLSLPEIFIANDFGPDRLLLNRSRPGQPHFEVVEGRQGFATPRSKVLGRDSFKGMGADFGNLDGDGRIALAVSNISAPYALLEAHNLFVHTGAHGDWAHGIAPFRDQSFRRGTWTSDWAWDIKFVDLLNSGRPALVQAIGFLPGERDRWPELHELAMGNDELLQFAGVWPRFGPGDALSGSGHDRVLLPDETGRFHDVWPLLGLDERTVSRGIAAADIDGDGRLSLVIARQWAPSLFLRNRSEAGSALTIDLRVPGWVAGTRAAIGAEARVTLEDGSIVTGFVDGGSGHAGRRAPEVHLGLGDTAEDAIVRVEIAWRDRTGSHRATIGLSPGRHSLLLDAGAVRSLPPLPDKASEEKAPK